MRLFIGARFVVSVALLALAMPAHAGDAGGNSGGGGGGTQASTRATTEEIHSIVESSKAMLLMYLNRLEYLIKTPGEWEKSHSYPVVARPPAVLMAKFFDSRPNIFEVIENATIETRFHGPCKDHDGRRVDGSIFAKSPARICISLARLQKKLFQAEAELQTDALVLHELTHLVGGDEKEAVYMQSLALMDLRYDSVYGFMKHFQAVEGEVLELKQVIGWMRGADAAEFAHLALSLESLYRAFSDKLVNYSYLLSSLRATNFDLADQYAIYLRILKMYAVGHDPKATLEDRRLNAEFYERGFAGQSEIQVDVFEINAGGGDPRNAPFRLKSLVAKKITRPEDISFQLDEIERFLDLLSKEVSRYREMEFKVLNT